MRYDIASKRAQSIPLLLNIAGRFYCDSISLTQCFWKMGGSRFSTSISLSIASFKIFWPMNL